MKVTQILRIIFLFFTAVSASSFAQDVNAGLKPYIGYSGGSFDHIDPSTGKLQISLPLMSYKQRGSLPDLSFSVELTSNYWPERAVCDANREDDVCFIYFDSPLFGARIRTTFPNFRLTASSNTVPSYLGCVQLLGCFSTQLGGLYYSLETSSGGARPLFPDRANPNVMRALDGSGFAFFGTGPNYDPFAGYGLTPPGTLYDSRGNSYSVAEYPGTIVDPNGNSISATSGQYSPYDTNAYPNLPAVNDGVVYTDSMGRKVPDPAAYSDLYLNTADYRNLQTDVSKCPNLGHPEQPALSAVQWTGPGPNGGNQSFLFCYTSIGYHTGFYSFNPIDEYPWPFPYVDTDSADWQASNSRRLNGTTVNSIGASSVLQSVVLPNGTFWGLLYEQPPSFCCSSSSYMKTTASGDFRHFVATQGLEESYGSLVKIITPAGGSISYEYQDVQRSAIRTWPSAFHAVKKRTVDDGQGSLVVTTFTYGVANGLYTTTENIGNKSTVHTFKDSGEAFIPDFSGGAQAMLESSVDIYDTTNGSTHVQSETYGYDTTYTPSGNIANILRNSVTTTDIASGIFKKTITTHGDTYALSDYWCPVGPPSGCSARTNYNGNDFVLKLQSPTLIETFDNSGVLSSSASTPRHTIYPAFEAANILDPIDNEQLSDGSGGVLSSTSYVYDAAGNLKSTSKTIDNSTLAITQYGRDGNGMINLITDPKLNKTTPIYDSTGLYYSALESPTTNGVTHKQYFQFDSNTGVLMKHVSENGTSIDDSSHATTYTYEDHTGLLKEVKGPPVALRGVMQNSDVQFSYQFGLGLQVKSTAALDAGRQTTSFQVYDGLGRMVQTSVQVGASNYNNINHCFDDYGNESIVTNPTASASVGSTGCANLLSTTTQFDVLGRPKTITAADGSVTSLQYFGPNASITKGGVLRRLEAHDVLGRLTRVCELGTTGGTANDRPCEINGFSGQSGAITDYTFDLLGSLTQVNQQGGIGDVPRVRRFIYDGLSRMTKACNPESLPSGQSCDGSHWSMTYTYDLNSNLQSTTDSRGQTVTWFYDALNRVIAKQSSGPNANQFYGLSSCYLYDGSGASGTSDMKGRLSAEWTQAGACPVNSTTVPAQAITRRIITAYDANGQVLSEQTCLNVNCTNRTHNLGYTYDLSGNVLTYTDGRGLTTFTQTFDAASRFTGLQSSSADPTHPSNLLRISGYGPYGWTRANLGNVLDLSKSYDSLMRVLAFSANLP